MYQYTLEIKLYGVDALLGELLENTEQLSGICCAVERISTLTTRSMRHAALIIHGGGDRVVADVAHMRGLCGAETIIACCASSDMDAEKREALLSCADEVWLLPLFPAHVLRRYVDMVRRLDERRQLHYTRLCLESVIDTSPDLIWCKDVRGAHLKVNQAFCTAVGKTRQQVEGRGHYYIWDIPSEEYAESEYVCLETEEVVLAKRERCLFDEQVMCKSGLRQFKTYKAPVIDTDGTVLGTVGVAHDVTRQSGTTNVLSDNIVKANNTINIAGLHYWEYSPQAGTAHLCALMAKELQLPQRLENYPQCLVDGGVIHPDSVEVWLNIHSRLKREDAELAFDMCQCLPGGQESWWRVKYTRMENGSWFGMCENIDDYKRVEKCFTISAMQNGITSWVYDIGNNALYAITNPLEMLGLTGQTLENVPYCFAQNPSLHMEDVRSVLDLHGSIKRGVERASVITRWRGKDDTDWQWLKLSYTTLFDAERHPQRAIGSAFNITEQVEAQHKYMAQVAWRENTVRDSVYTAQLNITQNRATELRGLGGLGGEEGASTVDDILGGIMGRVPLDAWDRVTRFYDRKELLKRFGEGATSSTVEHLFDKGDGLIWVEAHMNVIKNPATAEVEAFLSLKDVDKKKIAELSYHAAFSREHEALACVSWGAGTLWHMYEGQGSPEQAETSMPFTQYMEAVYLPRVVAEDKPAFDRILRLDEVARTVEERGVCDVHFRLCEESGALRQKHVQFFDMDRARQLLCMVVSESSGGPEAE